MVSFIVTVISLVGLWKVYMKAGEPGWASIVPFYSTYVLFKITYGNGWKFLLLLIPIVNIYFLIMVNIKLAKAFGQSAGFGLGLLFVAPVFLLMLGFGNYSYIGPQE